MKKDRITPAIGIVVVVLSLFLYVRQAQQRQTERRAVSALPAILTETQLMTVDELHARIKRVLDVTMPGTYLLDVDKNAETITVDCWVNGFGADVPNSALHDIKYLKKWNALVSEVASLCADLQEVVSNHGHPEYTVTLRLVNCDDTGQIFAVVERGELVYDVVADTPPGCEVPDPRKRVLPTNTESVLGNYVVNVYSKVFHAEACCYAPQIFTAWRNEYTGDRLDLIARGYYPCAICNP